MATGTHVDFTVDFPNTEFSGRELAELAEELTAAGDGSEVNAAVPQPRPRFGTMESSELLPQLVIQVGAPGVAAAALRSLVRDVLTTISERVNRRAVITVGQASIDVPANLATGDLDELVTQTMRLASASQEPQQQSG